jgi:glycosyltransferase involved in cell wall biosynthesis
MAQLVHGLSGRHDVAAIYLRGDGEPPMDDALRTRLDRIDEISNPQHVSFGMRLKRRTAVLRGVPGWASFTEVGHFARRTREIAVEWRPEIVQFEYHVMGQYAASLPDRRAIRILSEYEAGVLAAREHLATGGDGKALGAALQRRAWARFERRVIADVDAVIVFSERDRAALTPLSSGRPIVRIGIGTHLPATALDPLGTSSPARLVFVANFMHPPNVDAAERLVTHIFPRVRARVPSAVLAIVGANPPASLTSSAPDGVTVTGRVPDIVPWMNDAAVIVAPLRVGAGMRVKIVEALAYGKAVVASLRGLEGLDVTDGVHVAVAETDAEFVARIVELLESAHMRATLAGNAREWACANLGVDRWLDAYDALYASLARARIERP